MELASGDDLVLRDGSLKVAGKTNVEALAKRLAPILMTKGEAFAESTGANASYVALKAAITANQKVTAKGQQVVVLASVKPIQNESQTVWLTVHHYRLVQVPADSGPMAGTPELKVGKETNVGKLAGAIKQRVQSDSVAAIKVVGPKSASQAMKGVMIAQKYCDSENAGVTLVVLPTLHTFAEPKNVGTYMELRVRAM